MSPARVGGVVCIGSSAGGLRSLRSIFSVLPSNFPCPILVTQHFPADIPSHLPEILARTSGLTFREAVENDRLEAGVVLTCPSATAMGVTAEMRIHLRPRRRGIPDSIDHLFTTASNAAGPSTVAVVLSGLGADGAAGTAFVKKNGGTVLVESPQTAEWSGMPSAAIRAGRVDEVLASHDLAIVLAGVASAGGRRARDRG